MTGGLAGLDAYSKDETRLVKAENKEWIIKRKIEPNNRLSPLLTEVLSLMRNLKQREVYELLLASNK